MGKLLICSLRCLITIQSVRYRYVTPLDLVVTDTATGLSQKHGQQQNFLLTLACWDQPPSSCCSGGSNTTCVCKESDNETDDSTGMAEEVWPRWRSAYPGIASQRALQQILNSKLLPIACVECLIGCVTASEEQAVPSLRVCEHRLLNTCSMRLDRCSTNAKSRIHCNCRLGSFSHSNTDVLPLDNLRNISAQDKQTFCLKKYFHVFLFGWRTCFTALFTNLLEMSINKLF